MRIKQQQAERDAEKERLNTLKNLIGTPPKQETSDTSNDDNSISPLKKKASEKKIVCRSPSGASNISNVDSVDFDVVVEEGSWYDVFHDDDDAMDDIASPEDKSSVKVNDSRPVTKSPAPTENAKKPFANRTHMATIRRRLSSTSSLPEKSSPPQFSPVTNKPSRVPIQSGHSCNRSKSPSPTSKRQSPSFRESPTLFGDGDGSNASKIMNRFFPTSGKSSPKNVDAVNLVTLGVNTQHVGKVKTKKDKESEKKNNNQESNRNSFSNIRSQIDDQLFSTA